MDVLGVQDTCFCENAVLRVRGNFHVSLSAPQLSHDHSSREMRLGPREVWMTRDANSPRYFGSFFRATVLAVFIEVILFTRHRDPTSRDVHSKDHKRGLQTVGSANQARPSEIWNSLW